MRTEKQVYFKRVESRIIQELITYNGTQSYFLTNNYYKKLCVKKNRYLKSTTWKPVN